MADCLGHMKIRFDVVLIIAFIVGVIAYACGNGDLVKEKRTSYDAGYNKAKKVLEKERMDYEAQMGRRF